MNSSFINDNGIPPSQVVGSLLIAVFLSVVLFFAVTSNNNTPLRQEPLWRLVNTSSWWLERLGSSVAFMVCYFAIFPWALLSAMLIVWEQVMQPIVHKVWPPLYTKSTHYYSYCHCHDDTTTSSSPPTTTHKQQSQQPQLQPQQKKLFEQSLDIYQPISTTTCKYNTNVWIVLVVGSGWAGHRYLISLAANWWNAAGPQMIASAPQLQCPCICIRHRGGFPHFSLPRVIIMYAVMVVVGLLVVMMIYHNNNTTMKEFYEWVQHNTNLVIMAISLAILYDGILRWAARGAATLEDMMDDVAVALQWIHHHLVVASGNHPITTRNTLQQPPPPLIVQQPSPPIQIWFGGYSSGAHVAAMVLQRPDLIHARGIPLLDQWIDQFLFLSGVLGIRPIAISRTNNDTNNKPQHHTSVAPRFATDFVTQSIFGDQAASVSCPLEELLLRLPQQPQPQPQPQQQQQQPRGSTTAALMSDSGCTSNHENNHHSNNKSATNNNNLNQKYYPRRPHIFIGCQNELFGLTWLDHFFQSQLYHETLLSLLSGNDGCGDNNKDKNHRHDTPDTTTRTPPPLPLEMQLSKYIELPHTNHWQVLSSQELQDCLATELTAFHKNSQQSE